jgi:hypothetical protein
MSEPNDAWFSKGFSSPEEYQDFQDTIMQPVNPPTNADNADDGMGLQGGDSISRGAGGPSITFVESTSPDGYWPTVEAVETRSTPVSDPGQGQAPLWPGFGGDAPLS